MSSNSEIRQQLWEFVYDLLSPEEAAALEQRITSDPEVARAYAEVKLQTERVRSALRHQTDVIPLARSRTPAARHSASPQAARVGGASSVLPRTLRSLHVMALAASLLLAAGYFMTREPPRDSKSPTSPSLTRLTVLAPSPLHPDVSSSFSLRTRDLVGQPRSADVDVVINDAMNNERWRTSIRTDATGNGLLSVPVAFHEPGNRLEFQVADALGILEPLVAPFEVAALSLATHLATDRSAYEPGETLKFRSVTLPRPFVGSLPEVEVAYEILGPDQQPLRDFQQRTRTSQGVGSGEFALDDALPEGRYTLVAQSSDQQFPDASQAFAVTNPREDPWQIDLVFSRNPYEPGEELVADIGVRDEAGEPARHVSLDVTGSIDGQSLRFATPRVITGVEGTAQVRARIPRDLPRGVGELRIHSPESGETPSLVQALPIQVPSVALQWSPEGGQLVAGLPNQVFFAAHDQRGYPVELSGELRDDQDRHVMNVHTVRPGYGKFSLTPQPDAEYHLVIHRPENWQVSADALFASRQEQVSLHVSNPVVSAGEPLELELFSHVAGRSLVVGAYAHDFEVGRTSVVTRGVGESQRVELRLKHDVAGVIRILLFDGWDGSGPPRRITQRLAFQRPSRTWEFAVTEGPSIASDPRQRRLTLDARGFRGRQSHDNLAGMMFSGVADARDLAANRDEASGGEAPPFAQQDSAEAVRSTSPVILGLSVSHPVRIGPSREVSAQLEVNSAPRLPNFFQGLTDLAQDIPFAANRLNADLSELDAEELELLIGVHGNRLAGYEMVEGNIAGNYMAGLAEQDRFGDERAGYAELGEALASRERGLLSSRMGEGLASASALVTYDNLGAIQTWKGEVAASRLEARSSNRQRIGRWLVGLSLLALVGLGAMVLYRWSRMGMWIPSVALATTASLLAIVWLGGRMWESQGWITRDHVALHQSMPAPEGARVERPPRMAAAKQIAATDSAPTDGVAPGGVASDSAAPDDVASDSDVQDAELAEASQLGDETVIAESQGDMLTRQSLAVESFSNAAPATAPRSTADALGEATMAGMGGVAGMGGGMPPPPGSMPQITEASPRAGLALRGPPSASRFSRSMERLQEPIPRTEGNESLPKNLYWNPEWTIHALGESRVDPMTEILFSAPVTVTEVDVIVWAHSADGLSEYRGRVPLMEPISVEWPIPDSLSLGDEIHVPLQIRNEGEVPLDVRLQMTFGPELGLLTADAITEKAQDVRDEFDNQSEDMADNGVDSRDQHHAISARIEAHSSQQLDLPRLQALAPGRASVELYWEDPRRGTPRRWTIAVLPPFPVQSLEEAGWMEEEKHFSFLLPPPVDASGTAPLSEDDIVSESSDVTTGYLYLKWRGYPSLASELSDAAEHLSVNRGMNRGMSRGIADGGERGLERHAAELHQLNPLPDVEGSPHVAVDREAGTELLGVQPPNMTEELTPAVLATTSEALHGWLDREGVASPRLRRWATTWETARAGEGRSVTNLAVDVDRTTDLQRYRETRLHDGGWSTPLATAQAIQVLATDTSRPTLATEDHSIQIRDSEDALLAETTAPAGTTQPLTLESWWPVDMSRAEMNDQRVAFRLVHRGGEAIPFVSQAALYAPKVRESSSEEIPLGLWWLDSSSARVSRPQLKVGDSVTLSVMVKRSPDRMLAVSWGIPAGLQVDQGELDQLVAEGTVHRATLEQQHITLTFHAMPPETQAVESEAAKSEVVEPEVVESEVVESEVVESESPSGDTGHVKDTITMRFTAVIPGSFTGQLGRWSFAPTSQWQYLPAPLEVEIAN